LEEDYSLEEVCFVEEQVFPVQVLVVGVAVALVVLVVDDFAVVLVVVDDSGVEEVVEVSEVYQKKSFLCFRKIHHFVEQPLLLIIRLVVL